MAYVSLHRDQACARGLIEVSSSGCALGGRIHVSQPSFVRLLCAVESVPASGPNCRDEAQQRSTR
jgi:hypothetical protein